MSPYMAGYYHKDLINSKILSGLKVLAVNVPVAISTVKSDDDVAVYGWISLGVRSYVDSKILSSCEIFAVYVIV